MSGLLELVGNHTCPECGELRMNVASGSVCPNGHGRINKRVPAKAARAFSTYRYAQSLPQAERVRGRTYRCLGDIWVRSSRERKELEAGVDGDVIYLKKRRTKFVISKF